MGHCTKLLITDYIFPWNVTLFKLVGTTISNMRFSHHNPAKPQSLPNFILISSSICVCFFLISFLLLRTSNNLSHVQQHTNTLSQNVSNSLDHVVFGLASTKDSWPRRKDQVKLWWNPSQIKGCVFVDTLPHDHTQSSSDLPPLCVSQDTSRFRYTYRGGLRSAIRVARVVAETVAIYHNLSDVRWYILLNYFIQ